MKNVEGILGYNSATKRFGFLVGDIWQNGDGYHCGDTLEVKINGEWVKTRMEMSVSGNEWYLSGTDRRGIALEMLPARMELEFVK